MANGSCVYLPMQQKISAYTNSVLFTVFFALVSDGLALTVALIAAAAFFFYPQTFLKLLWDYAALLPTFEFLLVIILGARALARAPTAPVPEALSGLRLLNARHLASVVLAHLFLASFTTFKVHIPDIVPFYADPALAALDHWLHGGDPWRFARMLPAETGLVVAFAYSNIWFLIALGSLVHAAVLCPRNEFRRMAMSSLLVYVVLGIVLATVFSSVGPVFYDRFYATPRFAEFTAMLAADPYAEQERAYIEYLYSAATSQSSFVGTGISSMPSIHVGVAVIAAWYLTSRNLFAMICGWTYAVVILFGSVYTGWHYAVDGYLAALLATVFWFFASCYYRADIAAWMIRRKNHHSASQQCSYLSPFAKSVE